MKRNIKWTFTILTLLVLGALSLMNGTKKYPEGMIYNYLEYPDQTISILNLNSYVVYRTGAEILAFDKQTLEIQPVAQNIFDVGHSSFFLIGGQNDTLYYVCSDRGNSYMSYYAFDLHTKRKQFLHTNSILQNADGFLGIDQLLGMNLVTNDLFQVMGQQGQTWIDKTGIHTVKEMRQQLRKADSDDQWGIYDTMVKMAATDDSIWFVNYFDELIRFDRKQKSFQRLPLFPVQDFFLTEDALYYVSEAVLFQSDLQGNNIQRIGDITPVCMRANQGAVFALDDSNTVYRIGKSPVRMILLPEESVFAVDKNTVYVFLNGSLSVFEQ